MDRTSLTLVCPKLYPLQERAIFAPERYAVIEATVKAGKTVGCMVWIIMQAWVGAGGRNYWWVSPTFPMSEDVFIRAQQFLRTADVPFTHHDTKMYLELPNGSRIWFKGAENPDSLYGRDVWAAVIDEASRVKEPSWWAVRSTLTHTGGQVRIIGNVNGRRNWAYKLARQAQAGDDATMHYAKLTALDAVAAGIFPESELEDARRRLPDHVFRELYMAEPGDDGGNPFGLDRIAACAGEVGEGDPVCFGVDLARKVDFTAVVGLDAGGCVCVAERFHGGDWAGIRRRIVALGERAPSAPMLVDSTGVGDANVEELRRMREGVSGFVFSAHSKQGLMERLSVAISERRVSGIDGWLRDELDCFEYTYTRGSLKYSAPDGLHDDGVYALALAVMGVKMAVDIPFAMAG